MGTLDRLRKADAAELRFRLTCELRKSAGRLRAAVAPESWRRGSLLTALEDDSAATGQHLAQARGALRRGDWSSAHLSLAAHFATRRPRFPVDPRTLPQLTDAVQSRFPNATAEAVARAERMLEGRYDVLGYTDVPFGAPPAWHRDPVHHRQPATTFWSRVQYLDPRFGDHKVIWEINRHQHWLGLARAYHLTGHRGYYDAFVAQLENWMAMNPPLQGVNWASMLELGFRTLSWIWALHFFATPALEDAPSAAPWTVDLLLGVDRQLTHIEHNLSRYFSPNTHLSGEALAIYVAGATLPELAGSRTRAALGRQVLLEEIDRQINPDGGHAELSAHYHRYSTEFYLLATLVSRLSGDEASSRFEDAARRQAGYLRAIADDNGRLPLIGDDDGGQLFPIGGHEPADCRDVLSSAATILSDPRLAIGDPPEAAFWFCGAPPLEGSRLPVGSLAFPDSGYYVSRSASGDHMIFDAGPLGYMNAGHAHADALSVVLTTSGRPFLVDAGTCTYTMDPGERDRFRSTAMHNTVVIGGRAQSEPRGPFHWASRADAKCLVWQSDSRFDYVEGSHSGFRPAAHARGVLSVHGVGWIVVDHLLGPRGMQVDADVFWHLHPAWEYLPGAGGPSFRHEDGMVRSIACTTHLELLRGRGKDGWDAYSPVYGRRERGLCLRARVAAGVPATIATFIPAAGTDGSADLIALPVTRGPGPKWHGVMFQLSWSGQQAIVLAATGREVDSAFEPSPGTIWGGDLACTDARVAFAKLSGDTEHIIVHGTSLTLTGLA